MKKASDKGLTGPTAEVLSDIVSVIKSQLRSPVPLFVLGNSMGGAQVLTLASDPLYEDLMPSIRGWLAEAPFIAFPKGFEPGVVKVFLGRLAGRLLPHRQLYNQLPPDTLTRDPAVVKAMTEDALVHNTGTLEGLAGMLDRASSLEHARVKLNKGVDALWVGQGTGDKGTNYEASKKWFDEQTGTVKDKEFKTYDGAYHMLHADTPEVIREYTQDIGDWILARSGPEARQTSESKL